MANWKSMSRAMAETGMDKETILTHATTKKCGKGYRVDMDSLKDSFRVENIDYDTVVDIDTVVDMARLPQIDKGMETPKVREVVTLDDVCQIDRLKEENESLKRNCDVVIEADLATRQRLTDRVQDLEAHNTVLKATVRDLEEENAALRSSRGLPKPKSTKPGKKPICKIIGFGSDKDKAKRDPMLLLLANGEAKKAAATKKKLRKNAGKFGLCVLGLIVLALLSGIA